MATVAGVHATAAAAGGGVTTEAVMREQLVRQREEQQREMNELHINHVREQQQEGLRHSEALLRAQQPGHHHGGGGGNGGGERERSERPPLLPTPPHDGAPPLPPPPLPPLPPRADHVPVTPPLSLAHVHAQHGENSRRLAWRHQQELQQVQQKQLQDQRALIERHNGCTSLQQQTQGTAGSQQFGVSGNGGISTSGGGKEGAIVEGREQQQQQQQPQQQSELAALTNAGLSLLRRRLQALHQCYGEFAEDNGYVRCEDTEVVSAIFRRLRGEGKYRSYIGDYRVTAVRDLAAGHGYDSEMPGGMPSLPLGGGGTHFLTFKLGDEGVVATLRTSGTEPKIKYYLEMQGQPGIPLKEVSERLSEVASVFIEECLQPKRWGLQRFSWA